MIALELIVNFFEDGFDVLFFFAGLLQFIFDVE